MKWLSFLREGLPIFVTIALVTALHFWTVSLEDAAFAAGHSKAEAAGDLAIERLRIEHQEQRLSQAIEAEANAKAAAKRMQEAQEHNDKLASDLAEQQRKHRTTTDRLTGEIARVNDLYREALDAPPKPLPACVFTAGWVRIYDEATGARAAVPGAPDSGRTAAQVAESRALEQIDSGISQAAVLGHHVRYAEQCRNTADQLDALIDAVGGK